MPITLPVETRPDERSLDRTANTVEQRFARAGRDSGRAFTRGLESGSRDMTALYDRVSDAVGKLRVEQAKLNDVQEKGIKDSRLIAQVEKVEAARRREAAAVRAATAAYREHEAAATGLSAGLTKVNSTAANAISAIGNLAAGSRLGALATSIGGISSGLAEAGGAVGTLGGAFAAAGLVAGGAVIVGIGALTAGLSAATNALYDMGSAWDAAFDNIQVKTGLTGDALEQIKDAVKDVAGQVPKDLAAIGDIAAQVAQSLNLAASSADFRPLTTALGNLAHMGVEVNVRELGMAFRALNIDQDNYLASLEKLTNLSQSSGVSIDSITQAIAGGKGALDAFGLNLDDTLNLFRRFEEQGMSPDQGIAALNKAFATLTKAGAATKDGLTATLNEIKAQLNSGDLTGASERLNNLFGAKGGGDSWLKVLRDGAFELTTATAAPRTNIQGLANDTYDLSESWQMAKNSIQSALEPLSSQVFSSINNALRDFGKWVGDNKPEIIGFFTGVATQVFNLAEVLTKTLGEGLLGISTTMMNMPEFLGGGEKWKGAAIASAELVALGAKLDIYQQQIQAAGDKANDAARKEREFGDAAREAAGKTDEHTDALRRLGQEAYNAGKIGGLFGGGGDFGGFSGGFSPTPHRWASGGLNAREPGMVPNNVKLMDTISEMFPGVKAAADTGRRDRFGEHGSGEALDISVNPNNQLGIKTPEGQTFGSQINQWLLAHAKEFGLRYTIWQGKQWNPDGSTAPNAGTGITGGHWDHVHARVARGPASGMRRFGPDTAGNGFPTFGPAGVLPMSGPGGITDTTNAADMNPASPLPAGTSAPLPGLKPGPVGSTFGYNEYGEPGFYRPDSKSVNNAARAARNAQESIGEADKRVTEIQQQITELQQQKATFGTDTSLEERKRLERQLESAQNSLEQARKQSRNARETAQEAADNLAEAQRGRFTPARAQTGRAGRGMTGPSIGAPIAADFGLSQGLPGLAENLTNFLGNLAFAPALGALSGISAGLDPTGRAQSGGGLFGMLGALAGPTAQTGAAGYGPGPLGGSSLSMYGGTAPTSPFGGLGGGLPGMASSLTTGLGGMPGMGMGGGMGAPVGLGGMFGSPLGAPPGPAGTPAAAGMGGMGGATPNVPGMAGAAPTPSTMGGTSPGGGPGGGGFGGAGSTGLGGMAMSAIQSGISMAGAALDTQMPGAGTAAAMAANIGVQLGNRAIGQAGKAGGLLVGGIMETLLPANSKLGDPNANWFGKIAAGFAGAKPAIPNMAAQPADKPSNGAPTDPLNDPSSAAKAGAAPGDPGSGGITVNYTNNMATEDRAGADLTNHLMAMNAAPMAAAAL